MNIHTDIYLQGFIKLPYSFYEGFTKFDDWVSTALILSWGFYTLLDDLEFEIEIEEYLHIWDEV